MAWGKPSTRTTGDLVTAAIWNADLVANWPGGWYRKTTAKAVNTTVVATDLLNGEITIAAGAMSTNAMVRLEAWGNWLQQSGSTVAPPRLQLVLGATTLIDTGVAGTLASGATRMGWRVCATIQNAGATNAQTVWFDCLLDGYNGAGVSTTAGVFTTGVGTRAQSAGGEVMTMVGTNDSLAVDTTAACALKLNVINGTSHASYETKLTGASVELF